MSLNAEVLNLGFRWKGVYWKATEISVITTHTCHFKSTPTHCSKLTPKRSELMLLDVSTWQALYHVLFSLIMGYYCHANTLSQGHDPHCVPESEAGGSGWPSRSGQTPLSVASAGSVSRLGWCSCAWINERTESRLLIGYRQRVTQLTAYLHLITASECGHQHRTRLPQLLGTPEDRLASRTQQPCCELHPSLPR